MHLYLLRHAIAIPRGTPGYPNDDRPLTEVGVRKMKRGAKGLARIVPRLDALLTSPLERAHHTARIAAEALHCLDRVQVCEALLPGCGELEVFEALRLLAGASHVLLVGHEPGLGELASALLGTPRNIFEFRKAGAARIHVGSIPPERPGRLIWHLTPKQLRALGARR